VSALILRRASRPSGQWRNDDCDLLADGGVVDRIMRTTWPGSHAVALGLRASSGSHAELQLRATTREAAIAA
jgi:hypothetical protein